MPDDPYMEFLKTLGLFTATALAEIFGCYLPYLWLKQDKSVWLLIPAAVGFAFLHGYSRCILPQQAAYMQHTVVSTLA